MARAAVSRASRHGRGMCRQCQSRKALFRYRGQVKADKDHTLCFECFRSLRDQCRMMMRFGFLTAFATSRPPNEHATDRAYVH